MHQIEEIPKGSSSKHYFSSLNSFQSARGGPATGSGATGGESTKRKRVNYNIQQIQAQQLIRTSNDDDHDDDIEEVNERDALLNQVELKKANKRFDELNRENYSETTTTANSKFDIPRIEKKSHAASAVVKRLLVSKKTWGNYVDEIDKKELKLFRKLEVKADKIKIKKLCTICGNISYSSCIKCGSRVCCVRCLKTHSETRCSHF